MKFSTVLLAVSVTVGSLVSALPGNTEKRQQQQDTVWLLTAAQTREEGNIPLTTSALQISYYDRGLYFGDIQFSNSVTEPARLLGGSDGFSFLSYHTLPGGYQRLFAYPENNALGFTIPRSTEVPSDATVKGFTGSPSSTILFGGNRAFKACPFDGAVNSYQVFFEGGDPLVGCTSIDLEYVSE